MLLDLTDKDFRARVSLIKNDRYRLTLDYPRTGPARDRIVAALADLLRPTSSVQEPRKEDAHNG